MSQAKNDKNTNLEAETILLLHDVAMNEKAHVAAMGRISKETFPSFIRAMAEEHDRGTDKADMAYAVIMMTCGMCAGLFWNCDKKERMRIAEGIIGVFSQRMRELAKDDNFPTK